LQVVCAFDQVLVWQGFQRIQIKCAEVHIRQQRRGFPGIRTEFSTKLSTGRPAQWQLFSTIQNLAQKVKFYFNFVALITLLQGTRFAMFIRGPKKSPLASHSLPPDLNLNRT
jgi:hypothetical protein